MPNDASGWESSQLRELRAVRIPETEVERLIRESTVPAREVWR